MIMDFYTRSMSYFSTHVFLNSLAHACGGFGLAIVLQVYLRGDSFLPAWVGWALLLFSIVVHGMSIMKMAQR